MQAGVLSPMRRLQVAGLVLLGQIVGFLCATLVLSVAGLASHALPVLQSPSAGLILYAVAMVAGPLLCSWGFLKYAAIHPRPLIVCITSYLMAAGLFVLMTRLWDGSRSTVGLLLLRELVQVPLAR